MVAQPTTASAPTQATEKRIRFRKDMLVMAKNSTEGWLKGNLDLDDCTKLKSKSSGSHVHAGFKPVKFGSLKPGNSPVLSENFSIGVPSRLSIET